MSKLKAYDIIRSPVITEKATLASEANQVIFKVARTATKPEIKAAVEQLFKVEVESVTTSIVRPKVRRFRSRVGFHNAWKKAFVKLKEGHEIDFAVGD